MAWDREPAWSQDGKDIAYASATSNGPPGIFLMNADGTARHTLTSGGDASPAWSPDGHKILFSCESNQISDICVVNADGTGRRRLTEEAAENHDPAWQPIIH